MGDPANPIFFGTKKEISELCDKNFYYYYDFWSKYHLGMGWPCGKSYIYEQPDIVQVVEMFEWMYRSYSGIEIANQKLEVIGEYLKVGFNIKTR